MTRAPIRKAMDPAQGDLFRAGSDALAMPVAPAARIDHAHATSMLATLAEWAEHGWIRRLDAAFPRFLADVSAGVSAPVLLAAAITAHLEGRGHTCLSVDEWLAAPESLLGWKDEPLVALASAMSTMPRDVAGWRAVLQASAVVDEIDGDPLPAAPKSDNGEARPLVLRGGRLYLRRYWSYERSVAEQVSRRAAVVEPVDEAEAKHWLDHLFPGDPVSDAGIDWQKIACAVALRGRFVVVTGGPGTGKTHTAARLLALLHAMAAGGERGATVRDATDEPRRLRMALAAPTGKAAARLKQSIDAALTGLRHAFADDASARELAASIGKAKTLHALLGARPGTRRFVHHAGNPLALDVLVVDEASMVHLEMMATLLDALPPTARIVLLGDKDQLASVEAGAVLGELCRDAEQVGYTRETARYLQAVTGDRIPEAELDDAGTALAQRTVMLRTSHRFGGAIGALALAVNDGDRDTVVASLPGDRAGVVCELAPATPATVVELAVDGRAGAPGGYRSYLDEIARRPGDAEGIDAWARRVLAAFDRVRVLCAVRDGEWGVVELNRAIEKRLRDDRLIAGGGEWYEGRPVLVTRNDRGLGVFNGDVGVALRGLPGAEGTHGVAALRACFADGDSVRFVAVGRLADVETAYAMTVHKAQGSEFAHAVLVLPEASSAAVNRELVYTGITRARDALTVVSRTGGALSDALTRSVRRSSGLHDLLGLHPAAGAVRRRS